MPSLYSGRFAPTLSGGLHLGSLVVAVASYVDAKAANGSWMLRIEDVDPLREVVGAADRILHTLELYGFEWDGEVLYQSNRLANYEVIVERLFNSGLAYACSCSRKKLEDYIVYPGFCRDALEPSQRAAIRIRVPELRYQFIDRVQGEFSQNLGKEVGDFIIKRADGFFAYQLAVVLDDAALGINNIVRGADLLTSTPRQLYLQELLGFSMPSYLHVPVLLSADGHKLSKTLCAPILSLKEKSKLLVKALQILGQPIEVGLCQEAPQKILNYAIAHWDTRLIPRKQTLAITT